MHFKYTARRNRRHPGAEAATFRIGKLWHREGDQALEVSHLVDRTYAYHSQRELHWHLAERFERPVADIRLDKVA
jgi:hypothetical protein